MYFPSISNMIPSNVIEEESKRSRIISVKKRLQETKLLFQLRFIYL